MESGRDDIDEMGYLRMADSRDNTGYTVMAAQCVNGAANVTGSDKQVGPTNTANDVDELELTCRNIDRNDVTGHVSTNELLLVPERNQESDSDHNASQEEIETNDNDHIVAELAMENIEEDDQQHNIYADLYDVIEERHMSKSLCSTDRIKRWCLPSLVLSSALISVLVVVLITQTGYNNGKHDLY